MSNPLPDTLAKVRLALGRTAALASPPVPPEIPEPVVRLVHTDFGLAELFAARARENQMGVETVFVDDLLSRLIDFLNQNNCRQLAIAQSSFLDKLGVFEALREAGFDIRRSADLTLDESYDLDCGITDVYCAVAEVGGLVIRPAGALGRAVSLVPPIHVAILQPRDFIPDLVDLFDRLARDPGAAIIITGPSKTADIEMNIVRGVHGPGTVQLFILG